MWWFMVNRGEIIMCDDEMFEIRITLEDDFGRAMTRVKTKLSPPELMDKILELEDIDDD